MKAVLKLEKIPGYALRQHARMDLPCILSKLSSKAYAGSPREVARDVLKVSRIILRLPKSMCSAAGAFCGLDRVKIVSQGKLFNITCCLFCILEHHC